MTGEQLKILKKELMQSLAKLYQEIDITERKEREDSYKNLLWEIREPLNFRLQYMHSEGIVTERAIRAIKLYLRRMSIHSVK